MKTHNGAEVDSKSGHSILGASGMERWEVCPGSVDVILKEQLDSPDNEYSKEGTLAHEIAASALIGGTIMAEDPDLYEAVEVYVDYVNDLRVNASSEAEEWVEYPVNLLHVDSRLWGTADYAMFDPVDDVLHVVDYKHGMGKVVQVTGNPQIMYYAAAFCNVAKIRPAKIVLTIAQPRIPHADGLVRSQVITLKQLRDFVTKRLKPAIKRVDTEPDLFKEGPGCQFCPVAFYDRCEYMRKKAISVFDKWDGQEQEPDITETGELLTWFEHCEKWMKQVRNGAYQSVADGNIVKGWHLIPTRGTRKFINEKVVERKMLRLGFKPGQIYDTSMLSPAQMEKLLPKEQRTILSDFITKESSGFKLAPVDPDDSRDAKQVFKQEKKRGKS